MKINEIFYSIQGEGYYTGVAAVFVRFSGCNLQCPFCDTQFRNFTEMTEDEIINKIKKYPAYLVVFTGGEPTLQLTMSLVDKVHNIGKMAAIETNGTHTVPANVDWVTCSPKFQYVKNGDLVLKEANEYKFVIDENVDFEQIKSLDIKSNYFFIQPCDTGNFTVNTEIMKRCIDIIKENPKYRLSLQTQKIINVR